MNSMNSGQSDGTWSITTRVIVYAAIGAALYAVFNWTTFAIQIPGTQNVSIRPHFGLVTFFGFAFGPVAGFLVGFLFIWIELIIQPELGFNTILTGEYIPVIVGNSIAAAIVTPILIYAWEPLREQLGR